MTRARIVPIGFTAGFEGPLRGIIGALAIDIIELAANRAADHRAQSGAEDGRRGPALAMTDRVAEEAARDTARARQVLAEQGVDAVLVMRVVGQEQQISYTPGTSMYVGGPYYGSTWGYWGYGWGAAYSPGYMTTDQIVSVESLVYSVSQGKLLWAGQSETTNPEDVESFINELVSAVGNDLRKKGLIRPAS